MRREQLRGSSYGLVELPTTLDLYLGRKLVDPTLGALGLRQLHRRWRRERIDLLLPWCQNSCATPMSNLAASRHIHPTKESGQSASTTYKCGLRAQVGGRRWWCRTTPPPTTKKYFLLDSNFLSAGGSLYQ